MNTKHDMIEFFKEENLNNAESGIFNSTADFQQGQKLWLEVTVEDEKMSKLLLSWLYKTKDKDAGRTYRLFGCVLHEISRKKTTNNSLYEKMKYLLKEYEDEYED